MNLYVMAMERDNNDRFYNGGPAVTETRLWDACLINSIRRVESLNGEYGLCRIYKLVPVPKEEIESFLSERHYAERAYILSLLDFEQESEQGNIATQPEPPEVDAEFSPPEPQPDDNHKIKLKMKKITEALQELWGV